MNGYNVNRHLEHTTYIHLPLRQQGLWKPDPNEVARLLLQLEADVRARRTARVAPVAPSPWDHVAQIALFCSGCAGTTWDHQCWTPELVEVAA